MQTLQLTYAENIAMETLALIFVNTELKGDGKSYKESEFSYELVCKTLVYNDAEKKAEKAHQTFDMLTFD